MDKRLVLVQYNRQIFSEVMRFRGDLQSPSVRLEDKKCPAAGLNLRPTPGMPVPSTEYLVPSETTRTLNPRVRQGRAGLKFPWPRPFR